MLELHHIIEAVQHFEKQLFLDKDSVLGPTGALGCSPNTSA